MPGALGSLGSIFSGAAPIIEGATLGSGLVGNILNSITRGKAIGNLESAEKKFAKLTPEQLSGLVSRAEQPLSQDLLQNVGNLVQADLGTRGLSQAPGIFAAEESQALAPYKMQEQQTALQLIMKQLGLPIEYAQAILQGAGGGSDLSPLLMMMLLGKGGAGGAGGGGIDMAALANLIRSTPIPGSLDTSNADLGGLIPPLDTTPPIVSSGGGE